MSPLTRLGYAFAFSVAAGALTLLVLLLVSWDVANGYMESNYSVVVPALALVVGYLGVPIVQRRFKARTRDDALPTRGFLSRIVYSLAITLIISGIAVAILALVSRAATHTFFDDNYFAAVFLIAFFVLVPLLDRFRRWRHSDRAE